MATRFVRVDLTDEARDFRPIALEPGVPLLDRSGSNAKILFRWLGGMAGEPVWEEESVNFYARDDHGGRLEEAEVQPATAEDLKKLMADDVAKLKTRIAAAKPETPTERMLKKAIRQSFERITSGPKQDDADCYFFRYRDAADRWRLVWCWGYQRVDQEAAPSVVCTEAECKLLYVRLPGRSPKCPCCEAGLTPRSRKKRFAKGKRWALLLLLIAAALFYWFFLRARLIVTPTAYEGPVDARVEFQVVRSAFFSKKDVTREVVGVVEDPAIARFDQPGMAATLVGQGKTTLRFHLGSLSADVPITATAARNPDRLLIDPKKIDLAIGTTARPKVFGEYGKERTKVDLTDAVEWSAEDDRLLFAYDGLLEGLTEGDTTLRVLYRAHGAKETVAAEAEVHIANVEWTGLELSVAPSSIALGRFGALQADAIAKDKKRRYSVLESSQLATAVEPADGATVQRRYVRGDKAGKAKLHAIFNAGPTAKTDFEVIATPGLGAMTVTPTKLDMVVNQITDLNVVSPSHAPIRLTSSDEKIVEITPTNRLIGRREGKAIVEIVQGKTKRSVEVSVAKAKFSSIAFEHDRIVVPIGRTVYPSVLGRIVDEKEYRRVEIAADLLTTEESPEPRYADYSPSLLALRGVWPTREDPTQTLAVRFGPHRASAPVDVIISPGYVEPDPDEVVIVRILTDQDQPVRFSVGAAFEDFYVEAEYPDGFTRLVTKKATLQTPEPSDSALLAASEGQLIGLRPGVTTVEATFEGVRSLEPLRVEVTESLDVDELRIAPSSATIMPGETVPLDVVGYKNGRNVGIITGLGNITWQSANPQVARIDGDSVTGVGLGQTTITADLDGLQSAPGEVNVVDSLDEGLRIDPLVIRLRVGQSARIGTDLSVRRGQMDFSGQCRVTPSLSEVVRYVSATHSLVGQKVGRSAVAFTVGGQLANVMVEVLPMSGPIDGQVILEPAGGNLAVGQALDMRVYVVTPDGSRFDRTHAAVLNSSDPNSVIIQGNLACAMARGTSEITATLPGIRNTGSAYVMVSDEPITELIVEPPALVLSTGDVATLRIMGRAASGTHLLFPQTALTISAGGRDPGAVGIEGISDVRAIHPGQADVTVQWQPTNLSRQVPVTVADNPWHDLRIDPGHAAIHPNQPLVYQVTGMRGGQRRVLGPEDGVELFVTDPNVAGPAGNMTVVAKQPGTTQVVARLGSQQAAATLDVVTGTGVVGGDVLVTGPGGVTVYGPGGGYVGPGRDYWIDDYRIWDGERWIINPDYVVRAGPVEGLRFERELLRLAPDSPPTLVRVFEVLADGSDGREVTADPNLEITQPPDTVTVEMTESGPMIRPTGPLGETTVGAKLGTLLANTPMLISVGEGLPGAARLVVSPDPLVLWRGEAGTFDSVLLDPGGGLPMRSVPYTVAPAVGQDLLSTPDGQTLEGHAPGRAMVVITTSDPAGVGLSRTATVEVMGADPLTISPSVVNLQLDESTPEFVVSVQPAGGVPFQVPATLQSTDPTVLAPDGDNPGRFVAKAFGETPIRAEYRGKETFATVIVTGKRFLRVNARRGDETDQDFDVVLDVLADESEGQLEYRVYAAGETPTETWQPAELKAGNLQVGLRSGRIPRGPRGQQYHLTVEARNPADNSVQQYQYKFQLVSKVQEADIP